jgi:hypothetical protein
MKVLMQVRSPIRNTAVLLKLLQLPTQDFVDITNHPALVYKQDDDVGEEDMPKLVAITGNLAKALTGVFLKTLNGGALFIN